MMRLPDWRREEARDGETAAAQPQGRREAGDLREHLVDRVPVSTVCEKHQIQPSLFYYWQRQLFENGASAFALQRASSMEQRQGERIAQLEAKLTRKDAVIAEISEDLVKLRKEFGEP
jgi:transposase-like protein